MECLIHNKTLVQGLGHLVTTFYGVEALIFQKDKGLVLKVYWTFQPGLPALLIIINLSMY